MSLATVPRYLSNDAYHNEACCVGTTFSATIAEFIETRRGGTAILYEGYKGKEGKVFWRCEFHRAGREGRATSVGETVDVTCTEHNHPPDQASNKLVSSMRKWARRRQNQFIECMMILCRNVLRM